MKHPYTDEEIAQDFFDNLEEEERQYVLDVPNRMFMSMFHDGAGQYIRTNYNLWERPWKPEIVDGADISPQHPDAISTRVLEIVWDKCHAR
jgi:hypothetical protein